ncbi:hypothetical protein F4782DRAFT_548382 [Xylaria castorea]|nr:hypothetical protein F4782DRAFT_548382 [Xylaria castorea]
MSSMKIEESDIPSQAGKVALITGKASHQRKQYFLPDTKPIHINSSIINTGGSSGIGLATAKILLEKGATVHVLDVNPPLPEEEEEDMLANTAALPLHYHPCDVTVWEEQRAAFDAAGPVVDYVFVNAGVFEEEDYFADETDAEGALVEPGYRVLDVNLRAACNTVKLAWSRMRKQPAGRPYSIVLTVSATAYAPEQAYPVYSGSKSALLGLIRSLRSVMIRDGITINGVAPGATATNLVPAYIAEALAAQASAAVCSPRFVGLALVYSATAAQDREVQMYGKDEDADLWRRGRWNGRVILALGKSYAELEEPITDLRPFWLGRENAVLMRRAQAAYDLRPAR